MVKFERKKMTSEERKKFFESFPVVDEPKPTTIAALKRIPNVSERYGVDLSSTVKDD